MSLNLHHFGEPSRPTLVLVHGLTDDGTCWPDAVERWQDDWHVVAVDQRGHGDSPRFHDENLPVSPTVLADDLVEVLRHTGPAVLVGHSLGGLISARVCHAHPELVRGAVLEDPAKPGSGWSVDEEFSRDILGFIDAVTADPAGELERMRRETPWSETELAAWATSKAKVDRRYVREGLFLGEASWEAMFNDLRVPTLIVVPVGGEMAPHPELLDNPLVRLVEVPGAGHCVRRDRPEEFHRIVDAFLAELPEAH